MSKFNFSSTIDKIKASYKKDERRANQFGTGSTLESISDDPNDYVVMPEWWKTHFGILGLPFGKWVQISGKPDSGKTTVCLEAIRRAQQQGHAVIYVETEAKTGPEDLVNSGINLDDMICITTNITEEIFEGITVALDAIKSDFPDAKVLLIIDSYGNNTSMRDSEMNFTSQTGMVGGAAKTNRAGIQAIIAKQLNQQIACLAINYSYANIGSVGETNAGGRALEFACALIINASRVSDYNKTVKGVSVKAGINTRFRVTKNHFAKSLKDEQGNQILLPRDCNLRISAAGLECIQGKDE
jgi:RecA/RadA recombinase